MYIVIVIVSYQIDEVPPSNSKKKIHCAYFVCAMIEVR